MLRPRPGATAPAGVQVQISSLVEGQTVAPGAPLQVWVGATDPDGVASIALAVEAAGGASVDAPPERFTFPPDTRDTGSKVFTVNVGPLRGPSGTLTLTATTVGRNGRTFTGRRTVRVSGTAEDLRWEIVSADPKPMEAVSVVVRMVNPRPGAKIGYSLRGTDGYPQDDALTVGDDGTVRFRVPGSENGVVDVIEAWIEGTGVRRKASYKF